MRATGRDDAPAHLAEPEGRVLGGDTEICALQELEAALPDFDALPYAEAVRRRCACLRVEPQGRVIAVADPFDEPLREWARLMRAGIEGRKAYE